MSNTGYKHYNSRIEVFTNSIGNPVSNEPTGRTAPNTEYLPDGVTLDPDYVADVINTDNCPIGDYQLQELNVSHTSYLTGTAACLDTDVTNQMWFNGANINPVSGDIVYEDYTRETLFVGDNKYWLTSGGCFRISNFGAVTLVFICT